MHTFISDSLKYEDKKTFAFATPISPTLSLTNYTRFHPILYFSRIKYTQNSIFSCPVTHQTHPIFL